MSSTPSLFKTAYRAALAAFFMVLGLYGLEHPKQGVAIAALLLLLYLALSLPGSDSVHNGAAAEGEETETPERFQKRRRLFLLLGYYPLVGSTVAVLILALMEASLGPESPLVYLFQETPARFLLFGAIFGGLGFTWIFYRCPVCGMLPLRKSGKRGSAIDLNPAQCRQCGARLR